MNERDQKYIDRKKNEIAGYIAVATGAASMISIMEGKCTDAVIRSRDDMTERTLKCIDQIIKRVTSSN